MRKILLLLFLISFNSTSEAQIKDWFKKTFYRDKEEIIGVWDLRIIEKNGEKGDLKKLDGIFSSIAFSKSGHVSVLKDYLESIKTKIAIEGDSNLPYKTGTWSINEESKTITITFFKEKYFSTGTYKFKYTITERKRHFDKSKIPFLSISRKYPSGYYLFEFEKRK